MAMTDGTTAFGTGFRPASSSSRGSSDCIFCKIAIHEIPTEVLHEDNEVIAFPDLHPKYPVHLLVIPKAHISSAAALEPSHDALLGKVFRVGAALAKQQGLGERGFRLLTNSGPDSGQEVHHLHMHVLGGERLRPL